MHQTEKEIMSTHDALKKTYAEFQSLKPEIESFFNMNSQRKFTFIGCGSSFMIAKGCAGLFSARPSASAVAIAGGDYLINPDYYKEVIRDSIIIMLSRTGETTEMLRAAEIIKNSFAVKIVSVTLKEENALADQSDISIKLPWAYDKSVCQTRSVTNLYAASLLLNAICHGDHDLINDVKSAIDKNEQFKLDNRAALEIIGRKKFANVVMLAGGPLNGIAEEGALAFSEIALLPGSFCNLLDYRHGPIVLNNKKTLTIVALQSVEDTYQPNMLADLKSHGGTIVTVGEFSENLYDTDLHISVGKVGNIAVMGIFLAYIFQMIALSKAKDLGINPDEPDGLNLFVTL